jgi:hypothetical protein
MRPMSEFQAGVQVVQLVVLPHVTWLRMSDQSCFA